MNILLTGGAGYIGSHTYVALVAAGYTPVILDDFSNSHRKVLERLEKITGKPVICHEGDVANRQLVMRLMKQHGIEGVVHFAADKAVGESVAQPLKYYRNNICGAVSLMECIREAGWPAFVFSSSATVYGDPASVPIREDFPRSHTNPYGHTKLVCEDMVYAIQKAHPDWKVAVLRYFNPVGAHESGTIGEDPGGVPNNLMPYVAQVAVGKRESLSVFGGDYPTPDGTGVRDYIHVMDLAEGHVAALDALLKKGKSFTVNLGTGRGNSVLEVVHAFEKASGRKVPYNIVDRRPGDVAQCYADPALAKELLGWEARRTLDEMCADTWRWQSANPKGFAG
jgi:UDP-glucose 4-epimerase